jgi:heme-degrading monooxygenase HmoA
MIVETTTFHLAEGTSEEAFLAVDRRVQTELIPNQPGFLRRTLARRGERWIVLALWATEDDAAAFEGVANVDSVQMEFDGHLAVGSVEIHRYDTFD